MNALLFSYPESNGVILALSHCQCGLNRKQTGIKNCILLVLDPPSVHPMCPSHTKHFVRPLVCVLPLDLQGMDNALVSLNGNACHGQGASDNSSGLYEGDHLAHKGT